MAHPARDPMYLAHLLSVGLLLRIIDWTLSSACLLHLSYFCVLQRNKGKFTPQLQTLA